MGVTKRPARVEKANFASTLLIDFPHTHMTQVDLIQWPAKFRAACEAPRTTNEAHDEFIAVVEELKRILQKTHDEPHALPVLENLPAFDAALALALDEKSPLLDGWGCPVDMLEHLRTLLAAVPSIFFVRLPDLRRLLTFGGNPLGSMDLVHTVCKDSRGTINFWSPELRLGPRLHNDVVMLIVPFLPWCESPRLVNVSQAWRRTLFTITMTYFRNMFRPPEPHTIVSWKYPRSFGSAELSVVPPLVWATLPVTEVPYNAFNGHGVLSVRDGVVTLFGEKLPVLTRYGHLEELNIYRGKNSLYLCPRYSPDWWEPEVVRQVFALKGLRKGWCVCHCATPLSYLCQVTNTLHFCSGKMNWKDSEFQ